MRIRGGASEPQNRPAPAITSTGTAAVITAFNPPAELAGRVASMLEMFQAVAVVDDGSTTGGEVLAECERLGAAVIRQGRNTGIGAALNAGVTALLEAHSGLSWIVTFDQDSEPPAGLLAKYDQARRAALADGITVGAISPESVSGSRVLSRGGNGGYFEVAEPIQSALLLSRAALDTAGGFDEGLFIDGVDTDFYWRLRKAGFRAVAAPGVALEHSLGTRSAARFLGRPLRIRNQPVQLMQSAPFRYYYIGRNRIHLLRRYFRIQPRWMLRGLALDLRHVIVVGLLGTKRRQRLGYFVKGTADGLRGRTGKAQDTR